jgi:hypothetical protein
MDAVTVILILAVMVTLAIAVDARLQLAQIREQQDRDARYAEWWLRSMEERKADKWEPADAEE